MPFLLLLALLAWAAWQGAQARELAAGVKNLAEKTSALQSQQEALQSEIEKIEHSPIVSYPQEEKFEPLDIPLSVELQEHAWTLCKQNDIPFNIFMRLMWRESRYQTDALNHNTNGTYDRSLMQINDVNRKWLFGHFGLDTKDPYDSIEAAVVLLRFYLNKGYILEESLACYGAGEYGAMIQDKGFTAARKLILDSKNYM